MPSDDLLLKTLTSVISTTNIVAMGAQEKGMGEFRGGGLIIQGLNQRQASG